MSWSRPNGGGLSKKADAFLPHLTLGPKVMPARLKDEAGMVGAALATAAHYGEGG